MKIGLNVGDKVKVLVGKFSGKEDKVIFIDKKTKRVRLEKLKKLKSKGKKGGKDLHGTFHLASLVSLKPKPTEPATTEAAVEPKAEPKVEQKAG